MSEHAISREEVDAGISVPLMLIAAVFTGLAGVIAVCLALVALGVLVTRGD